MFNNLFKDCINKQNISVEFKLARGASSKAEITAEEICKKTNKKGRKSDLFLQIDIEHIDRCLTMILRLN